MNKVTITSLVLTACLVSSASSLGSEPGHPVGWIMTGNSPSVDRSSASLANGDLVSGISYAKKALKRKLSPIDKLIASHNLCVAITMTGNEEDAKEYCNKLDAMEKPALALKMIKPGLFKVTRHRTTDSNKEMMVESLITQNLALLNTEAKVTYAR